MLTETAKVILPVISKSFARGTAGPNMFAPKFGKVTSQYSTPIGCMMIAARNLSTLRLTKNLNLITNTPRPLPATVSSKESALPLALVRPGGGFLSEDQRPLCVLMGWLMAKKKHMMKYAQFYLDQGFDVLSVSCNPYQLLFPQNGGKVIAKDVLTFMRNNPQYNQTTLHGFSISGFVWGQVMALMSEDQEKYHRVINGIVGQIWDSPVDVEGISQGMGTALFPNNKFLKFAIEAYVSFHVNTFQEAATQHYIQSSILFHNSIVKAPALFLCSEDDPVAFHYIVERAAERWERNGVKVFMKTWKSSPHVSHMWRHPEEYKAEMKAFLDKIGLLKYPNKFQVKSIASN